MPTLDEIKNQLTSKGLSNIAGKKETKELPNILAPDEIIQYAVTGIYKDGFGVLFATNKRAIFIDKGILYGLKVEDFPYDKISSVQYETGMLIGKITIHASGNNAEIKSVEKSVTKKMGDGLRELISKTTEQNSPKPSPTSEDFISKLERLAALKEKGILTDAEFADQKAKLLS